MLVEIAARGNFFTTWIALTVIAFLMTMAMSGALFYRFYWAPTFERWRHKSNPEFPRPELVRREVLQTLEGIYTATLCPALALHLGWSQAYAGLGGRGWGYLVLSFFVVWIGSDLYEFAYHRLGHTTGFWWTQHKSHHVFYNPSRTAASACSGRRPSKARTGAPCWPDWPATGKRRGASR